MKSMALQQGRWMVHIPCNFNCIAFMERFNYLKAAEPLWAEILLSNFKSTGVPGTHLINLARMKG